MIGKALGFFLAPLSIVYGAYVLWPNSHCDRVYHAAAPAYWVGRVGQLAVEPFVGEASASFAENARINMADAVAYLFYARDSYATLCATDPIQAFRHAGKLNERGLIALDGESIAGPNSTVQYALATHRAQTAPAGQPATPAQNVAGRLRLVPSSLSLTLVAIGGVFLLLYIFTQPFRATVNSVVAVTARKLWRHHVALKEHFLPRKVVRPSAGKLPTDLTDKD